MTLPPAPDGFHRYLVKAVMVESRNFDVYDAATDAQAYYIDGRFVSLVAKGEVKSGGPEGSVVYDINGHMKVPQQMTITGPDGSVVASLHQKMLTILKEKILVEAQGQDPWTLEGNLFKKDYTVTRGGQVIARISQKLASVADSFVVDVADGVDVALVLALVWSVSVWTVHQGTSMY